MLHRWPAGSLQHRFARVLVVLGLSFAVFGIARAQTDEIQVYDASIAAPGVVNLTWHDNYTFSGAQEPAFRGGIVPEHSLNGVPEWAYGVKSWFEAGLYLPLYSVQGDGSASLNGFKLRALFVSPDAASRRFFYGINFEFSYNRPQWDPRRYTSEIRPIIGWRVARVTFILNPILDNSYTGVRNLDFAPAARLAVSLSPRWEIAAEEYSDFGAVSKPYTPRQQSHQLFAVLDYVGGPLSVEIGLGAGLTPATDHRVGKLILSKDLN